MNVVLCVAETVIEYVEELDADSDEEKDTDTDAVDDALRLPLDDTLGERLEVTEPL